MTSRQILRTEDRLKGKFLERDVLGLNIFRANDVHCSIGDDPQIEFLVRLCGTNGACLNVGNLFDYADGPDELFAGSDWAGKYRIVNTGCYGGEFYDSKLWDTFPSLFFDNVSDSFFHIMTNGDSLIRKLLVIDAIAYFICPRLPTSAVAVEELLNSPFESSDALTEKSLELFKLVAFSHADGDYFSFSSRTKEDFSILDEPLAAAADIVEISEWYKENWSKLDWDDEYSACLKKMTP